MSFRVWAFVGATTCLLFSAQVRAQCTKDVDCKGDRVCEDGACVNPPATAPPAEAPASPLPEATPALPATAAPAAPASPTTPPVTGAYAPRPTATEAQPYQRRDPGLMTAGIVMTSAALPLALFAAYYSDTAKRECVEDQRAAGIPANNDCENARETRNVVIGIVALATIGVGIPLIVYGAKKVPSRAQAVLTPRVSQRGGEVSLHVTF